MKASPHRGHSPPACLPTMLRTLMQLQQKLRYINSVTLSNIVALITLALNAHSAPSSCAASGVRWLVLVKDPQPRKNTGYTLGCTSACRHPFPWTFFLCRTKSSRPSRDCLHSGQVKSVIVLGVLEPDVQSPSLVTGVLGIAGHPDRTYRATTLMVSWHGSDYSESA